MNIRKLFVIGGASFCFVGCSHPPIDAEKPTTIGSITYQATTSPNPPHTGDDDILLTLWDSSTHALIGDANVTGSADMIAPQIKGQSVSGRSRGGGVYDIPVRFAVGTQYDVTISVERRQKSPVTIDYKVDVQQ